MEKALENFKSLAQSRSAENKKFLHKLKKSNPKLLDANFHQLHDKVFAETDCLQCANCCKTTSPIITRQDIDRLSKALRMTPGEFVQRYLQIDEDQDYVFQSSPCPFLGADNHCSVYENRPKACREYPHTNRKKMVQILNLTYHNTKVCPAVLEIVERMKRV